MTELTMKMIRDAAFPMMAMDKRNLILRYNTEAAESLRKDAETLQYYQTRDDAFDEEKRAAIPGWKGRMMGIDFVLDDTVDGWTISGA